MHERITTKSLSSETWERIRHEFLMNGRSINWITEQDWAPSKPTILKAINKGMAVRTLQGVAEEKPPIKGMKPAVQSTLRASKGAARVLAVVQAAAAGDGQSAAEQATQVLPGPPPRQRRGPKALPSGQSAESAGHPGDSSGVTPVTVLRELARLDGAGTIAEETIMLRDGKATAYEVLMLARAMVADGRTIQAKIAVALTKLQFDAPMDILLAVKINSAISLAADRATRVVQRTLELERELLGDPRDATGATGAPGEVFAMTEEEAIAEMKRCAHVAERYGVPFAVGSHAELPVVATNEQDVREVPPSVFIGARDDELEDQPDKSDSE